MVNISNDNTTDHSEVIQLLNSGLKAKWHGDYEKSLRLYKAALEEAIKVGDPIQIVCSHVNIGNIYREWKDIDLAWAHYYKAHEASETLPYYLEVYLDNATAGLAYDQGDMLRAIDAYSEVYNLAKQNNDIVTCSEAKHNIASVFQSLNRPNDALPLYEEAYELGVKGHMRDHALARTLCQIGVCWIEMGLMKKAQEYLNQALTMVNADSRIDIKSDILHNLGVAKLQAKMVEQALADLRSAANLRLHIADQATTRQVRTSARERALSTIGILIDELCVQWKWDEAFQWSERVRAREMILVFRDIEVARKDELLHLKKEIWNFDKASQSSIQDSGSAEDDYWQNHIKLNEIEEKLEVSKILAPGIDSMENYLKMRSIHTGENFLIYIPCDSSDALVAINISKGKFRNWSVLLDSEMVDEYSLSLIDPAIFLEKVKFNEKLAEMTAWLKSQAIFKGLDCQPGETKEKLVLIPWGKMHNLPLEAVPLIDGPVGHQLPVWRWFSISQMMQIEERHDIGYEKRVLIIADPTSGIEINLPDLGVFIQNGELPGAILEGNNIAFDLREKGWQVDYLFRSDATVQNVMEHINQHSYRLIHYAGHAVFDSLHPEQSALLLRDKTNDTVYPLTSAELTIGKPFKCNPIVVLSACQTGGVNMKFDMEPEGLLQALFSLGASAVLVAGWPIPDSSTVAFMKEFYGKLLEGEQLCDAVLQARQYLYKSLIEDCNNSKISYWQWSTFQLYGSGGQHLNERNR